MRLCNSRLPEEHFVCYQTSQRNWVIIKVLYRCLQRYLLGWRISRLGFVTPIVGEVSLGPLGNTHHISLASITTNMLVVRWCITERVKRLAGNEIELGIGYRRSNLGQVTYRWQREQRMLLCGLTDKDLRRICRNQYEHPGSTIGALLVPLKAATKPLQTRLGQSPQLNWRLPTTPRSFTTMDYGSVVTSTV